MSVFPGFGNSPVALPFRKDRFVVIRAVAHLLEHSPKRIEQGHRIRGFGFWQFVLDAFVQCRELVERDHRVHVVFDVEIDVPAQKPHHGICVDCP